MPSVPAPVEGPPVAPAAPVAAPVAGARTDALLVLVAVIWGVNWSVVKYGTVVLAPLAYNGVRVALATVALVTIAAVAGGPRRPSRADAWRLLALGVLGNGIYQVLFVEGLSRTRAGNASLVMAAAPALVAIVGRLAGVEMLGRRALAGIAVSLAGMGMVIVGSGTAAEVGASTLVGDLLILTCALVWAVYAVWLKPVTHRVGALYVTAYTLVGGAVPLLLVAAPDMAATDWSAVSLRAWAAVAYSGLGALTLAYLLYYRGLRVLGPTRTAMYGNLQPIVAVLVAWLVLGEVPTAWQGVGAAGVIGGLLLTRT